MWQTSDVTPFGPAHAPRGPSSELFVRPRRCISAPIIELGPPGLSQCCVGVCRSPGQRGAPFCCCATGLWGSWPTGRHATSMWQGKWFSVTMGPYQRPLSNTRPPAPELSRNVLRPACGSVGPCSIRSCLSRQMLVAGLPAGFTQYSHQIRSDVPPSAPFVRTMPTSVGVVSTTNLGTMSHFALYYYRPPLWQSNAGCRFCQIFGLWC